MRFALLIVVSSCLCSLAACPLAAQQTSPLVAESKPESIQSQLQALLQQLQQGIADKDLTAVLDLMDENVVITTQDAQQLSVMRGHSQIQEYLQRNLTGKEATLKSVRPNISLDEQPTVFGADTIVASGSSDDHYVMLSGGEYDLKSRWSATVVGSGDSWKLASLHISSNLFDNPIFNTARDSLYRVGGIALGLGLIAGLLLSRLFLPRAG